MKAVAWVGSSLRDLRGFPKSVRETVGEALFFAQNGEKHPTAKPMRGFGGASVLEVVEDDDGDTYRAVYTVRYEEAIYVLHCFQKKSKSGIATPKQDLELIRSRLGVAEARHKEWLKKES